jgi:NAD(P)-dependent dehydrogenase (short-subunit alcohol dehydrogenase family)
MDLKLQNKTALITGASRGIGFATAERLRAEGCNLHLVSVDESRIREAAEKLKAQPGTGKVQGHAADLGKPQEIERFAKVLEGVDILVNNAGDIPLGSLTEMDDEAWHRAWDLKVFGYINFTRLAFSTWRRVKHGGVVVNVIGHAGENYSPSYIAGTTGCAALMALTRALGAVSHSDGIRVVGINPGPVTTDRMVKLLKSRAEAKWGDGARWPEMTHGMPFGRAGVASEIADAVAFLASDVSAYTTGTILTIDGGISSSPKHVIDHVEPKASS